MPPVEETTGPQSESRSKGSGMLLISPVVFSGWFVMFFESAYEPDSEKVRAIRRSTRSCRL